MKYWDNSVVKTYYPQMELHEPRLKHCVYPIRWTEYKFHKGQPILAVRSIHCKSNRIKGMKMQEF